MVPPGLARGTRCPNSASCSERGVSSGAPRSRARGAARVGRGNGTGAAPGGSARPAYAAADVSSHPLRTQPVVGGQASHDRPRPRPHDGRLCHRRADGVGAVRVVRTGHPGGGPQPRVPPVPALRGGRCRGVTLVSAGRRLDFHLARPATSAARDATRNGVVIAHELPVTPGSAGSAGSTYPQLADRVAADTGWMALTFACRGAGRSPGQFSPGGWLEDLRAAIEMLRAEAATVWLAGFGFGGVLALRAGADDPAIGGVAVLATPSDLSPWIRSPATLATLAHEAGLVESATPPGLEP